MPCDACYSVSVPSDVALFVQAALWNQALAVAVRLYGGSAVAGLRQRRSSSCSGHSSASSDAHGDGGEDEAVPSTAVELPPQTIVFVGETESAAALESPVTQHRALGVLPPVHNVDLSQLTEALKQRVVESQLREVVVPVGVYGDASDVSDDEHERAQGLLQELRGALAARHTVWADGLVDN